MWTCGLKGHQTGCIDFWRETLRTRRQKPVPHGQSDVTLSLFQINLFRDVLIGVGYATWRSTWGWRNELCCNKIDRLCAFPCGFTWLNHDWWSISPTGSPLTHHSAQLQTQRTGSLPLRDLFLSCQSFLLMDSGLVAQYTPNRMVVLSVSLYLLVRPPVNTLVQLLCNYWPDWHAIWCEIWTWNVVLRGWFLMTWMYVDPSTFFRPKTFPWPAYCPSQGISKCEYGHTCSN